MVFTELDHATAAVKNGLTLPARTVIVFGNPRAGTPNMQKAPTLAIDVPRKLSFGKMTKERSGSPSTPGNTYTITSIRRMDYRPIRWPLKPSTNSSCTLPSKPPNNEALCCRARIRDMTEAVIEGKLYPNAAVIPASASGLPPAMFTPVFAVGTRRWLGCPLERDGRPSRDAHLSPGPALYRARRIARSFRARGA